MRGGYKVPDGASNVLGLEVSGTVVQVGKRCSKGFQEGDDVMALLTGGGYAEFVSADERCVMPSVTGLSQAENAAIPEAFITAYGLLFFVAQIKQGDRVLVHAGASSVGQALVQMAYMKGAYVVATTRSPHKIDLCLRRGAAQVVVLPDSRGCSHFEHEALSAGVEGWAVPDQYLPYHAVFDPVGASYLESNVSVLHTDGSLVLYGLLGNEVEDAILAPNLLKTVLFKRISILPSTLRSRDIYYKADLVQCFMADPLCGYSRLGKDCSVNGDTYSGDVTKLSRHESERAAATATSVSGGGGAGMVVAVDRVFPIEDVLEAHGVMRRGENVGKVVLSVSNTASALDWFAKQLDGIKF